MEKKKNIKERVLKDLSAASDSIVDQVTLFSKTAVKNKDIAKEFENQYMVTFADFVQKVNSDDNLTDV